GAGADAWAPARKTAHADRARVHMVRRRGCAQVRRGVGAGSAWWGARGRWWPGEFRLELPGRAAVRATLCCSRRTRAAVRNRMVRRPPVAVAPRPSGQARLLESLG